jgi:hypothetical protein
VIESVCAQFPTDQIRRTLCQPYGIFVFVNGHILSLPVRQRRGARGDNEVEDTADCDAVGMSLDDASDLAIRRRECPHQKRHTGRPGRPRRAGKPVCALEPTLAGKSFDDVELIGSQNIHAEGAVTDEERPGRQDRLILTISDGGSTESEETDETVIPEMS